MRSFVSGELTIARIVAGQDEFALKLHIKKRLKSRIDSKIYSFSSNTNPQLTPGRENKVKWLAQVTRIDIFTSNSSLKMASSSSENLQLGKPGPPYGS